MSSDRRLFMRYFNATFLCVCPSTQTFSWFVSIVNCRFANLREPLSIELMIFDVRFHGLFRQQIMLNIHCYKKDCRWGGPLCYFTIF